MSELPKTASVVIVGGGIMGASTAYHLSVRGIKNILLLEKESYFCAGSTGRCAGGLRHQFNTEVNIKLSKKSLSMIDNLEREIGTSGFVKKCGYLFVLTNEKDVSIFKKSLKIQQELGINTEWLSGNEVRKISSPCIFSDALAGTYNSEDGIADPNNIVMGYISCARSHGVVCISDCFVKKIVLGKNRVRFVDTNIGRVETETVVNACGPWSASLGSDMGLKIPVFPLRRQWFVTGNIPEIPDEFPFVIDFSQSLYFHQEGKGLLSGMSNQKQKFGIDQSLDLEWEMEHIEAAIKRMPFLKNSGIKARQAGLYEVTPDAHPIIGSTPVEGFYLLTGFSGHGFMHGPVCGKLMAEILIDGRATSVDISMLDYARFEEKRLIPEYNVV